MKLGLWILSRGVGLWLPSDWDCGLESRWGFGCLSLVSVVLLGTSFCNGQITCLEESYRAWCAWVWSQNLDKNLGPLGAVEPLKTKRIYQLAPMLFQTATVGKTQNAAAEIYVAMDKIKYRLGEKGTKQIVSWHKWWDVCYEFGQGLVVSRKFIPKFDMVRSLHFPCNGYM